jgi:hypothetical protein
VPDRSRKLWVPLGTRWVADQFGLGKKEWLGQAWGAFAALVGAGICSGLLGYLPAQTSLWLLSTAFAAAALTAIFPSGIFALFIFLSALGGAFIGLSSTPDPGPFRAMAITVFGSFVGANITLVMAGGWIRMFRERFDRDWSLIGVRILAAWIATISVSMAALALVSR